MCRFIFPFFLNPEHRSQIFLLEDISRVFAFLTHFRGAVVLFLSVAAQVAVVSREVLTLLSTSYKMRKNYILRQTSVSTLDDIVIFI